MPIVSWKTFFGEHRGQVIDTHRTFSRTLWLVVVTEKNKIVMVDANKVTVVGK